MIEALSSHRFNLWYGRDPENGSDDPEVVATKLIGSEVVLSFISADAANSSVFRQKLNYAIVKNKKIIVVYLSDIQLSPGLEMQLAHLPSVFKFKCSDDSEFFSELLKNKACVTCRIKEENPEQTGRTSQVTYREGIHHNNENNDAFADEDELKGKFTASEVVSRETEFFSRGCNPSQAEASESLLPVSDTDSSQGSVVTANEAAIPESTTKSPSLKKYDIGPALWEFFKSLTKDKINTLRFRASIKKKLLDNATEFIANNEIKPYWIIAMIADETNGKNGIIFTRDKAYIGAVASQFSFEYSDLHSVEKNTDSLTLYFTDGTQKPVTLKVLRIRFLMP